MARWSADGTEVPEEVRAALRPGGALPEGPADAHVHIRAGIGSLLGDTHVVLASGRLRVVGRKTSLDPLLEVELAARPRVDESGYRPVLVLPTRDGDERVEVTALEEAAVEDLLDVLPPVSLGARAPGVSGAGELPDLPEARAALLGALARRIKQRKAELVARRHARRTATLDHRLGVHRGAVAAAGRGGAAASDDRWRARHAGTTRRAAKREASIAAVPSASPIAVVTRLALVVVAGAVVFGLFAFLGRALAARP